MANRKNLTDQVHHISLNKPDTSHITQSVLEWACMIMKTAPNVTVIGSETAGADGNVTRTVLPGNYKINFSGLGIYYPDGTETQRIGIHVDIPIIVTVDDLIQKRDPALAKAIEFANLIR